MKHRAAWTWTVLLAGAMLCACGGDDSGGAGDAGSGGATDGTGGASGTTGGTGGVAGTGGASGTTGGAGGTAGAYGGAGGVAGESAGAGGSSGAGGVAGESAGTGGSSGVGGAAGTTGGTGAGGSGGVAATCNDPDGADGSAADIFGTRTTVTGTNGSFTDACDESGNLVEYACEMGCDSYSFMPMPYDGGVPCTPTPTGIVTSSTVDCGGECADGACSAYCPEPGDRVRYESMVAGVVTLQNLTRGRTYSCSIIFDRDGDGFDCGAATRVGTETVVFSLGISSQLCAGTELGNIGTDDPTNALMQECTFACTTVLP